MQTASLLILLAASLQAMIHQGSQPSLPLGEPQAKQPSWVQNQWNKLPSLPSVSMPAFSNPLARKLTKADCTDEIQAARQVMMQLVNYKMQIAPYVAKGSDAWKTGNARDVETAVRYLDAAIDKYTGIVANSQLPQAKALRDYFGADIAGDLNSLWKQRYSMANIQSSMQFKLGRSVMGRFTSAQEADVVGAAFDAESDQIALEDSVEDKGQAKKYANDLQKCVDVNAQSEPAPAQPGRMSQAFSSAKQGFSDWRNKGKNPSAAQVVPVGVEQQGQLGAFPGVPVGGPVGGVALLGMAGQQPQPQSLFSPSQSQLALPGVGGQQPPLARQSSAPLPLQRPAPLQV